MPSFANIVVILLFIGAAAIAVGFLSTHKKGNRLWGLLAGGMIAFLGAIGLATGKIQQKMQGGPPLDGPLAYIVSTFMLVAGLYAIYKVATGKVTTEIKGEEKKKKRRIYK